MSILGGQLFLFLLHSRTQCECCRQFLHCYHTLWSHGEHRTMCVATVPVLPLSRPPPLLIPIRPPGAPTWGSFRCVCVEQGPPFVSDAVPLVILRGETRVCSLCHDACHPNVSVFKCYYKSQRFKQIKVYKVKKFY